MTVSRDLLSCPRFRLDFRFRVGTSRGQPHYDHALRLPELIPSLGDTWTIWVVATVSGNKGKFVRFEE